MKKWTVWIALLTLMMLPVLSACSSSTGGSGGGGNDGIKVGVLFSLSGATAVTEKGMANATLMAIDEINASGGVNGKKLIPVQEDLASEPSVAATKAKKLLLEDKVAAIIGCYTSASRQAVLPIVEQNNGLLVYPTLYEGEEYSKNIIYTGATPNQQLQDFVPWLVKNVGKKFFFVGSDYVYPAETNKQVKALLQQQGGQVVGEEYVPIGQSEFSSVVNKIKAAQPDVVFSDLVGDSVSAFYKQYKNFGMDPKKVPIASPITAETDLISMTKDVSAGNISSYGYFQTLDTPENKKFVEAYHNKYGKDEPITDVHESAYFSTYLLKMALEKVQDPSDTTKLIDAFAGLEFDAPEGKIKVDEKNHHTWLHSRIAKVNDNGQFEVIVNSDKLIHPEPWAKVIFPDHAEPWNN
ncbi:transporter substrate-binding domain-containing protein [Ferviditalea candida]|uniref:Transporter substrate-binding domain-containing protein n=1 Tax=Ferviditalea candida TaxID=3108399 RepID=A0ABU5ZLW5_9BACL|nr:transporter substrate-binding domain-containing protein [Paenibacillaceae bacterium T2]